VRYDFVREVYRRLYFYLGYVPYFGKMEVGVRDHIGYVPILKNVKVGLLDHLVSLQSLF
jgi:hypothetical protein